MGKTFFCRRFLCPVLLCLSAGRRKGVEGYCLFKEYDTVRTHSLYQIIRALNENRKLEQCAKILDLYYIAGRYPDAFPGGAPYEMITREQAEEALASVETIYAIIVERTSSGK